MPYGLVCITPISVHVHLLLNWHFTPLGAKIYLLWFDRWDLPWPAASAPAAPAAAGPPDRLWVCACKRPAPRPAACVGLHSAAPGCETLESPGPHRPSPNAALAPAMVVIERTEMQMFHVNFHIADDHSPAIFLCSSFLFSLTFVEDLSTWRNFLSHYGLKFV